MSPAPASLRSTHEDQMTDLPLDAVLFDIGGTLVHAAPPATPTDALVAEPIGLPARDLAALRSHGLRRARGV